MSAIAADTAISTMRAASSRAQESTAQERTGQQRDYLSFSAIRAYQACPLRYYFKYVACLPEPSLAAALVFGTSIHRALEFHFRELQGGERPPPADELFEHYAAGWRERAATPLRFSSEADRAQLDATARRILQAFVSSAAARPTGRILAVEETVRGPLSPGLPDLLGRVDLLVETPTELVISDWKTSRTRWSAAQVAESSDQLLLYAELARDWAPGKRVRLQFTVFTKTKEVAIDEHRLAADPRRLDRLKKVVERVWRSIQAGHYYPAPSPLICGTCPYHEPCRVWSA